MTTGWLNEFSNLGLELLKESTYRASLVNKKKNESHSVSDAHSKFSRAPSLNTVLDVMEQNASALGGASSIAFDTL